MNRSNIFNPVDVGFGVALLVSTFLFCYRPSTLFCFVYFCMFVCVFIRFLWLLGFINETKSMLCPLMFIVLFPLSARLGYAYRISEFRGQLPLYNNLAQKIESVLDKTEGLHVVPVPEGYNGLVRSIVAKRVNSRVIIECYTGGGYPVKHVGYLFDSAGDPKTDPDTVSRWPDMQRVADNWYTFTD